MPFCPVGFVRNLDTHSTGMNSYESSHVLPQLASNTLSIRAVVQSLSKDQRH